MSTPLIEYSITHAGSASCGEIPIGYTASVTIAEKLKAEMDRLNMKPIRFAVFANVPQPYLSKWLNGRQGISPQFAARIARATERPIEYFLPTPPAPDARAVLAAAFELLDDQRKWLVARYATRLARPRSPKVHAPIAAQAAGQNAKDKRRRGPSSGSAPAA